MVAIASKTHSQVVGEQRVALRGITRQAYQQILHALPQSRAARLIYDRGTLEITMPLESHEFALRLIERFIIIGPVEQTSCLSIVKTNLCQAIRFFAS